MAENNLDDFQTVFGVVIKITPNEDKGLTNFTVKSYSSGAFVNCTLWHNRYPELPFEKFDTVFVNGPVKREAKKQGDGFWINLNVKRIGIIPMETGVDDRVEAGSTSNSSGGDAGDAPDVL
jgi:hypothetical protein